MTRGEPAAAGARGEVQRRGLQAAGRIVERLIAAVDGDRGARPDAPTGDRGGDPPTGPAAGIPGLDLDGLVDLWAAVTKQSLQVMGQLAQAGDRPRNGACTATSAGTSAGKSAGMSADADAEAGDQGGTAAADGGAPGHGPAPAGRATEPETATVQPQTCAAGPPTGTPDAPVEVVLRETGKQVRRAMLDAIPDGEPHPWLYRLARSYPSRAGKAIRPSLCLATCRAFGGRDEDVLPVAVAIELLHNAFLIHDDVADGSERRRGRPTLTAEHGPALALNAGDALAVVANQVLRRHLRHLDDDLADRVFGEFETMALRTLEGQATELGWRHDGVTELAPEDYLGLIMHKTCWYTTIHPLRVGALVGSGGRADLRPMVRFGFHLGAAFQIRDDLLNLVGDEPVYGKEINGDLHEGKRTLMLIHLTTHARGADRATVDAYLRMERAQRTAEVVGEVRRLMDAYGSLDFAARYAEGIAGAALDAFDDAFAPATAGPDTRFVRDLVPYMLGRSS